MSDIGKEASTRLLSLGEELQRVCKKKSIPKKVNQHIIFNIKQGVKT